MSESMRITCIRDPDWAAREIDELRQKVETLQGLLSHALGNPPGIRVAATNLVEAMKKTAITSENPFGLAAIGKAVSELEATLRV